MNRCKWLVLWMLVSGLNLMFSQAYALEGLTPVDREVPEFSLQASDEENWQTDSLEGKPWVVNFWATWCPPCIEEIPSMNAAWAVLEEKGVGMLAINAGEGSDAVKKFLARVPINFPTLLGDHNSLPDWSVRALPTTVVIDKNGRVVFEALGPREWDNPELLNQVIELL